MITSQSIAELQRPDFDVRQFILKNFVSSNFSINYPKIQLAIPNILDIQHQTCEDIASSVDNNLDDYVQISTQLSALQQQLDALTLKFSCIEDTIDATRDNLQETIYQINVIVENLKLVSGLQQSLKQLRKLIKYLSNIELNKSNFGLIDTTHVIMKCRTIYQQLDKETHCRQICQQYDIVTNINNQYHQLQNVLESELAISLQEQPLDQKRLHVLLSCLQTMGLSKTAEKLTIQFLLKPKLDAVYQQLLQNRHALLKDSTNFNEFIESIENIYNEHQAIAKLPNGVFQYRQILLELVYIYLSQKDCANVYSVVVPDLFIQNYQKILHLKQSLNVTFQKESEIEKKFFDKWNLNTYFQMRQAQIIRGFESKMQQQLSNKQKLADILKDNIIQCLSQKIFIQQLQPKFYELSLQLANRFLTLVNEQLKQVEQTEQAYLKTLLNDLSTINAHEIISELKQEPKLGQLIQQKINMLITNITKTAIIQVINDCHSNLEPFNGVPAKFRMTNREFPTQSSNFCSNIFRPLQQFLQDIDATNIRKLIITEVCDSTLNKFQVIKKQALDTCDKNEQLMQKMGVKKNESQDNSKIRAQFTLDEEEMQLIINTKFVN